MFLQCRKTNGQTLSTQLMAGTHKQTVKAESCTVISELYANAYTRRTFVYCRPFMLICCMCPSRLSILQGAVMNMANSKAPGIDALPKAFLTRRFQQNDPEL